VLVAHGLAAGEDGAADDAVLTDVQLAGGEVGDAGADAGREQAGLLDRGAGEADDAAAVDLAGPEQRADGEHVLVAEVPDDAAAVDGVELVDVGADVARGVDAVEVLDLEVGDAGGVDLQLAGLAEEQPRGELGEDLEAVLEVGLATGEHGGDVGGVRVGVDGGDEQGPRGAVGGGDLREGARADRGPQARLEQEGLDRVGVEVARSLALDGRVGGEVDLLVLFGELDHEADERPLLAAVDGDDGAGGWRGEADAGGLAVLEQHLAALDLVADLGLHSGLHAEVVGAEEGDPMEPRPRGDGLLGIACDRQVEPLRDAVCCHGDGCPAQCGEATRRAVRAPVPRFWACKYYVLADFRSPRAPGQACGWSRARALNGGPGTSVVRLGGGRIACCGGPARTRRGGCATRSGRRSA
jgi:hypothetical protein